jgi:hypothetical protein
MQIYTFRRLGPITLKGLKVDSVKPEEDELNWSSSNP